MVAERVWGMKVGGAGNSLRRTGTGVLRVCFTVERIMVESQGGELVVVAVCACAHCKREKRKNVESKSNRLRTREKT